MYFLFSFVGLWCVFLCVFFFYFDTRCYFQQFYTLLWREEEGVPSRGSRCAKGWEEFAFFILFLCLFLTIRPYKVAVFDI